MRSMWCVWLPGVALSLGLAQAGRAQDPSPQSPQELIEAYVACYDPVSRRFSKQRLLAISSRDSVPLLFPRAAGEALFAVRKSPEAKAELDALLTRHGLDPAEDPLGGKDLTDEEKQAMVLEPRRALALVRERLLAGVDDERGFIHDLLGFVAKHQTRPDEEPLRVDEVTIEGDRARGILHGHRDDGDGSSMSSAMPFFMLREGGRWTYDLLAWAEDFAASLRESRAKREAKQGGR